MLLRKQLPNFVALLLSVLLILLPGSISADPIHGYIITKDNLKLTGAIGRIDNQREQNRVLYINDFGSRYSLRPELIKGFVFVVEDREIIYETRKEKELWYFLRVLSRGEGMTLYADPLDGTQTFEERDQVDWEEANDHSYRYYLQIRRRSPIKVKRLGFRKQIKSLLQRRAPELAEKIGQPGFRYRDLQQIIEAYNESYRKTRFII